MPNTEIELYPFSQNGRIPNNSNYPLLLYRQAIPDTEGSSKAFEKKFEQNSWGGSWTNGVYDYHHYHSTSHEVLGVYSGSATLTFGGPGGQEVRVKAGDMVVIPAGVGHCRKEASSDFKVVGAYPVGQEDYDICTEKDDPEEKKKAIAAVALPSADPLEGSKGRLLREWRSQ